MIYVISRVLALQALYTFEHGRSVNMVLPEGPLHSHSSLDRPVPPIRHQIVHCRPTRHQTILCRPARHQTVHCSPIRHQTVHCRPIRHRLVG